MQQTPVHNPAPGALACIPVGAGVIAVGGGIGIWIWWWLGLPPLPPLTALRGPMAPLNSLCFVLLGGALLLWRFGAKQRALLVLASGMTLAAALIASLALLQAMLGRDLGIDLLMFRDAILRARASFTADDGVLPGRMGGTSALAQLALATGLLAIAPDASTQSAIGLPIWRRWLYGAGVVIAIVLTLASLIIYIYATPLPYGTVATPMAAGTALMFAVLSVGMMFVRPDVGAAALLLDRGAAGLVTRRLLLAVAIALPILGTMQIRAVRLGVMGLELSMALQYVAGMLLTITLMVWTNRAIRELDRRRERAESNLTALADQRRRMLEIGQSLIAPLSAETVVEKLRAALPAVIAHTWFGLYELDAPAGVLRPLAVASDAWQGAEVVGWAIPVADSVVGAALRDGRAVLLNNAELDPRSAYPPGWTPVTEHLIAVPLQTNDQVFGMFVVTRNQNPPFGPADLESAQFLAGYAALALVNARLFEQAARSQELAHDRAEMLRAIGDNLPSGVIYQLVRDSESTYHYTYISSAVERMGFSAQEMYDNPMRAGGMVHQDDQERYQAAIRHASRTTTALDIEVRRYQPNGELRWHHINNQPRRLASGQLVWDGITIDITAQKQSDAALQTANRELRRRVDELAALNQIAQAMTQWVDLPTALLATGSVMSMLFSQARIALWQIDEHHTALLELAMIAGRPIGAIDQRQAVTLTPELARLLATGTAHVFAPGERDPLEEQLASGYAGGVMLLPLRALGQPIGLLCLRGEEPERFFTPSEQAIAETIASTLANAIDNARRFAQAQLAAAEDERRRLARELHDSVSQALFAAARIAATLPQTWELDPEEGHDALLELRRLTAAALAEMRALLVELRPRELVEAPLHEVLEHLVPVITSRSSASIQTMLRPIPLLPSDVQVALYRLTQEALNNVSKHAHAHEVTVSLQATPAYEAGQPWRGAVTVRVADDGCGFDLSQRKPGHLGLLLMQERAAAIGATLDMVSANGAGTQVTITWPSSAAAQVADHGL